MRKTKLLVLAIVVVIAVVALVGCIGIVHSDKNDEKEPCEHIASDWIIDKTVTCLLNGSKHKECKLCHEVLITETIPAPGHSFVRHEGKNATCTESGWLEYQTCSRCNYTSYCEVPAKGHKFKSGICYDCGIKDTSGTEGLLIRFNSSTESYEIASYSGSSSEVIIPYYYNDGKNGVREVTSICYGVFQGHKEITSVVINDNITTIGRNAFYNCNNIESITIPFIGASKTANNGYDEVLGYIFGYYTSSSSSASDDTTYQYSKESDNSNKVYYHYYIPKSLKTVIISDSATKIPQKAFYNCANITNVTIGKNVKTISMNAFTKCSNLTTLKYNGTQANWKNINKVMLWRYNSDIATVVCTDGTITL